MARTLPQRKSPRLQGYDYRQAGAYFVTLVTWRRIHLFGRVQENEMALTAAGEIASACWVALPEHHPGVELDAFVVMPNHVHGVIFIGNTPNTDMHPPAASLGTVIGSYKSGVTRRIRETMADPGLQVWQGRFHDHIIRDEADLYRIQTYLLDNPSRWAEDTFYSADG